MQLIIIILGAQAVLITRDVEKLLVQPIEKISMHLRPLFGDAIKLMCKCVPSRAFILVLNNHWHRTGWPFDHNLPILNVACVACHQEKHIPRLELAPGQQGGRRAVHQTHHRQHRGACEMTLFLEVLCECSVQSRDMSYSLCRVLTVDLHLRRFCAAN